MPTELSVKIAIVILNYNGKSFLEKFLANILTHSTQEVVEIIIADNASTDDSVSYLKEHYPDIRLISIPENLGFAGGYNYALAKVQAEYYLLLNSDVEVTPSWLEPLLEFMDTNQQAAACMPKVLAFYNKNKFEHAGAAGGFIDSFGYPFCRGRVFEDTEHDYSQYNENTQVFWTTGACMLVRAKLFHQAGGFDEDFFAHMEEIDLCWRLQLMGYSLHCIPAATVYHVGGGTLNYQSPFKTFLNFRNNLYMLHKNLPKHKLLDRIFIRLILDGIAALSFLLNSEVKHFRMVIKAHVYYWQNLSKLHQKRRFVKSITEQRVYPSTRKSIVIERFLKGKTSFSEIMR